MKSELKHIIMTMKKSKSNNDNSLGYCVKCRQKRKIRNPKMGTMKNGRKMMKGNCEKCNTKMCRVVS